jgi:hypothetical protein
MRRENRAGLIIRMGLRRGASERVARANNVPITRGPAAAKVRRGRRADCT